jgi:hypothetical protein
MSLLPQVNAYHTDGEGQYDYFFALASEGAKLWSKYPAISTVQIAGEGIQMSPDVLLSTTNSTLLVNGQSYDPASWALYPAVSTINAANNALLSTIVVEIDGHFLTAGYEELLLDGIPIATSTTLSQLSSIQDWALYEAISTIDCVGNKIANCASIQLDGSIVTTAGNNILVNAVNPVSLWANYQASSNIDVNSKNINNANQLNFITAVPGFTGASINALNTLNFSYATALVGQAGINNLNNIAWWNPDYPGVPGFYINLYTKQLSYNGGANSAYLTTDTRLCVPSLYTSAAPGSAGGKLEVLGAAAQTATINGNPCSASWSQYPATEGVQMNFNQILNAYQIQFARQNAGPFNLLAINNDGFLTAEGRLVVTSPASADVDLAVHGLLHVRDIAFNAPGHLLAINGGGDLTYNGQVINTGPGGDVRNWANYVASSNVVIPAAYYLSINAENTLTYYKDSHLNTNIYHGVAGNESSPDFISFPTTFQVGTTVNPAREITMTAGALGFGINSDTEINIDALELLEMRATTPGTGVVTIESGGDFNLTALVTTFEVGEWNTVAGAVTMEIGSLDIVSAGNIFLEGTLTTLTFGATTLTTGALNLLTAAVVAEIASMNVVSAGNVTTLGTQIGFTAGTKFETLSASDTNLVANGAMNITGDTVNITGNQINISTPTVYAPKTTLVTSNVQATNISADTAFASPQIAADTILRYHGTNVNIPAVSIDELFGIAPGFGPNSKYLIYDTGTRGLSYTAVGSLGPTGATGPAGPTGSSGPTGPAGPVLPNIVTRTVTTSTLTTNVILPLDIATVNIPSLNISTVTGIPPGTVVPLTTASVYYDYTDKKLFYDTTPFSVIVLPCPITFALTLSINEQAFILTSSGSTAICNFTTSALSGSPSGFYITVKNGNPNGGGNDIIIQENGVTVPGPTSGTLYSATTTANASICYLLWDGARLTLY